MTTIKGNVRIKESRKPIPGLVVSVLAKEKPQTPAGSVETSRKRFDRSLGSVLTSADGSFQIEFDPKPVQESEAELMLVVLAPSAPWDAADVESQSLAARTLHRVKLTQLGSKQSEAMVIHIFEDQLRKHQIWLPAEQADFDVDKAVAQIVASHHRSTEFQSKLKKELGPVLKERFKQRRERRQNARKFVANLHVTPKAQQSTTFVRRGEDGQRAIRSAMELGLAAIGTTQGPPMVIHLNDNDLAQVIGPDTVADRFLRADIDRERLCKLLNARRGGSDLIRVRELIQDMIDADKDDNGGEGPEEAPPLDEIDVGAEISERVRGQLADMPLGAPVSLNGQHEFTVEQLNTSLPKFKLPTGPADVAAFHDFHNLQIAFRHVWTEAFDDHLREQVEDLYELYVELHDEFGMEYAPLTELEEAQGIRDFLQKLAGAEATLIAELTPPNVTALLAHFGYPRMRWFYLSSNQRNEILDFFGSGHHLIFVNGEITGDVGTLQTAKNILDKPEGGLSRLERLGVETAIRLSERYAFQYFAPNTVNFGLLLTYRQLWEPGPYQVGDLVSTIPLAPGEKRRFETKQVVKRTRAKTELDKALASRSREMTTTQRADAEIVNKASMRSNFQMTAQGSFQIGIADITASSQYSLEQAQESARTKKDFREAVVKAAQEYRNERALEVKTTDELTAETTTSGELSNPNNELTVTYLLYELERQYTISERIHRVTPVVLVAQDVPAPNEITESWLLAHEWILRRVLLDDSLAMALDYLTDAFPGEELGVQVRKANWEIRTQIVAGLQATVAELLDARDDFRGDSYLLRRGAGPLPSGFRSQGLACSIG